MTNPQNLQGIYQYKSALIYLAWEPVNECYYYKHLFIGTSIQGYSSMKTFNIDFSLVFLSLTPLQLGWLPNSAIPSDVYPELFI